jgi:ABC-2 type transport system permease protein
MASPFVAILWAQWRALWNIRAGEGRWGRAIGLAGGAIWYGLWALVGIGAFAVGREIGPDHLARGVPWALLVISSYWQLAPILSASLGASLDIRKLLFYPIPRGELFRVELLLRAFAGMEMLLVVAGGTLGLLINPAVPPWAPLPAAALFIAFNLFTAAGVRSLLDRLMSYKRVRETAIFAVVLLAALPQILIGADLPPVIAHFFSEAPRFLWPWTAAARLALGAEPALAALALAGWVAVALAFGRRQFYRGLAFDFEARAAADRAAGTGLRWSEAFYRLPGAFFRDPFAALMEKELRSLLRTPRFRLLFLMGFSFGVLMWWPMYSRGLAQGEEANSNYTVAIVLYAVVLLSDAVVWNVFGFDRSAAQLYFSMPVPLSKALAAKNAAAVVFIVLDVAIVTSICALVRLPVPAARVAESYAVALVLCVYLTAAGNLASVYQPRASNPDNSWGRSNRSHTALLLLAAYPVLALPVALAYGARYAFESELWFYGTLFFAATAGVVFYFVAMDSALRAAESRKEKLLAALSESAGPVAAQ